MTRERFDVFVVGGGGAGSEVAFSLGSRDMKVAIAERDKLGGECNHYGCVPTKAMLASARVAASARDAGRFGVRVPSVEIDFGAVMDRVRRIIAAESGEGPRPFEDRGITVVMDEVRLVGPHELEAADGTIYEADRIVLATGSEAVVPPVDGLADGPYWTNKEAIWSPSEPPASLAVIGSGAIGIEFATIYSRFGSRVTVVESAPQIVPNEDPEVASALRPALEAEGIRFLTGVEIGSASHGPDGWLLHVGGRDDVRVAEVLVATGRRPCFDGHDLDAAGVSVDDRGRPVLDDTLRTTADGIWACGDATGDLLFTHVGDYEARLVVADILGTPWKRDYRVVPRVTFCEPEVASVGLTEPAAAEDGRDVHCAMAGFRENERAVIDGRPVGLVKVVADGATGEILGGHIVGEHAGELIHQVVGAMAGRLPPAAIGDAVFAYPTLSERVRWVFRELAGMEEHHRVESIADWE
ncbi:MAG TPA: NAD(P)/FAD-dependent oxidoreductase [Actinomycetota bacterium]|jgi:pyruvate/2-oxoglutarate dehydrogenase complex dihydrolipoamide dehydrogenase (E3) component